MRKLLITLFLLTPVAAQANLAKCLLGELPGTANDVAAGAIMRACLQKHPEGFASVKQGSGRGWFGYESSAQCVAKHAKKTASRYAASGIAAACKKLYDPE